MSYELIAIIVLCIMMLLVLYFSVRTSLRAQSNNTAFDELLKEMTRTGAVVENKTEKMMELIHALQVNIKQQLHENDQAQNKSLSESRAELLKVINEFSELMSSRFSEHSENVLKKQNQMTSDLHEVLTKNAHAQAEKIDNALKSYGDEFGKRVGLLSENTDQRLKEISGQVEKRLGEGFEKTTETFTNILKRLTQIDEAQKKITELSSNVVSLQEVLSDKRSRGAFGEVQLSALVNNVMPPQSYKLQHVLSNNTRVDCMLFLPDPTGNVAVDSKFPLESYQKMTAFDVLDSEKELHARQFKQDIKKHIKDISDKYIIPNETSEGAIMFIPAEAVFAEIHAHHPDLVEEAHRKRVWMVSPTTFMAILTTARAVIKDDQTRKQVHLIQEHLGKLSQEFGRFEKRMDNLSRHIGQANKDVNDVKITADKINRQFVKIEKVDIEEAEDEDDQLLPG